MRAPCCEVDVVLFAVCSAMNTVEGGIICSTRASTLCCLASRQNSRIHSARGHELYLPCRCATGQWLILCSAQPSAFGLMRRRRCCNACMCLPCECIALRPDRFGRDHRQMIRLEDQRLGQRVDLLLIPASPQRELCGLSLLPAACRRDIRAMVALSGPSRLTPWARRRRQHMELPVLRFPTTTM
jgi:hypothetical protein